MIYSSECVELHLVSSLPPCFDFRWAQRVSLARPAAKSTSASSLVRQSGRTSRCRSLLWAQVGSKLCTSMMTSAVAETLGVTCKYAHAARNRLSTYDWYSTMIGIAQQDQQLEGEVWPPIRNVLPMWSCTCECGAHGDAMSSGLGSSAEGAGRGSGKRRVAASPHINVGGYLSIGCR